jgi:predicted glycosyltransferase involved in capsule biosynthesis
MKRKIMIHLLESNYHIFIDHVFHYREKKSSWLEENKIWKVESPTRVLSFAWQEYE